MMLLRVSIFALPFAAVKAWVPLPSIARFRSVIVRSDSTDGSQREFEDLTLQEQERYLAENKIDLDVDLLPTIDADAEVAKEGQTFGDMNGLDDPRDVEWRLKAEDIVRSAVATVSGVKLYDITWNIADLQVLLEPSDDSEESSVSLEHIVAANQAIQDALEPFEDELDILGRHELEVSTKGAPDVLSSEREFAAFKGYEVVVSILDVPGVEPREPVCGNLVGRDVHETTVSVKGRPVRIPNYMVAAVTLPEAMDEPVGSGSLKGGKKKKTAKK